MELCADCDRPADNIGIHFSSWCKAINLIGEIIKQKKAPFFSPVITEIVSMTPPQSI